MPEYRTTIELPITLLCTTHTAIPGSWDQPEEPACIDVDNIELFGIGITDHLTEEQHRELASEAHEMWRDGGSKL